MFLRFNQDGNKFCLLDESTYQLIFDLFKFLIHLFALTCVLISTYLNISINVAYSIPRVILLARTATARFHRKIQKGDINFLSSLNFDSPRTVLCTQSQTVRKGICNVTFWAGHSFRAVTLQVVRGGHWNIGHGITGKQYIPHRCGSQSLTRFIGP